MSRSLAAVLLFLSLAAPALLAQTTWTGGNGTTTYGDPLNWTSGVPNSSSVTAIIPGNTALQPATDANYTVGNLTLGTVNSSASLTVSNGNALTIGANGAISNNGTLSLASSGSATSLLLAGNSGNTTTLSGSGILQLSNNANNFIESPQGGVTFVNSSGSTIQGAGAFYYQAGPKSSAQLYNLTNGGIIDANESAGLTVHNGGTDYNTGTLEATNGATLTLSNAFRNAGGLISASGAGSTVVIDGFQIQGGTLSSDTGGVIQIQGGTLNGTGMGNTITIAAGSNVQIPGGSAGVLGGTIVNNGTFSVNGATLGVSELGSSTEMLNGTGTYVFSDSASNLVEAYGTQSTLVNGATMQGAAVFTSSYYSFNFTNNGTLSATGTNPIVFSNGGNVTNNGTFNVNAGSTMQIGLGNSATFTNFNSSNGTLTGGTYTIAGTLQFQNASIVNNAANITLNGTNSSIVDQNGNNAIDGVIATNSGSLTLLNGRALTTAAGVNFMNSGSVTIGTGSSMNSAFGYLQTGGSTMVNGNLITSQFVLSQGTLSGIGTVTGPVFNNANGNVVPGDAPGRLTVTGLYEQTSSATLEIDIAGSSAFSSLDVLGLATLDGELDPVLEDGYIPTPGTSFEFLDYASFSGMFDNVENQIFDNGAEEWLVSYNAADAILTAESNPNFNPAPEPTTFALLGVGLVAVGYAAYRRRAQL